MKVVQQVDQAWEARLKVPVCVNNDGKWDGEEEAWMRPYNRVRVEVKIGDAQPVALIDGPVVGFEGERSTTPGKSVVTIVVHDDTAFLNREDELAFYQTGTDSEIAQQIFQSDRYPGPIQVDPLSASRTILLRQRAAGNEDANPANRGVTRRWHAYVLPDRRRDRASGLQGVSKKLTACRLCALGPDRNLASFNATNNHWSADDWSSLTIKDKNNVTKRQQPDATPVACSRE